MLAWVQNLGFAGSGADAPVVLTIADTRGKFLIIATGVLRALGVV